MAIAVQAVLSTLFRLGAWLHLRVDPVSQEIIPALIALLLAYSLSVILEKPTPSPVPIKIVEANGTTLTNGHTIAGKLSGNSKADTMPPNFKEVVVKPSGSTNLPIRLLFSIPSSKGLKFVHFLVNLALVGMIVDFNSRHTSTYLVPPSDDLTFARVSGISHQSARLHVRYPLADEDNEKSGVGSIKILFRQFVDDSNAIKPDWQYGPVLRVSEDDDWVATAELTLLTPNTKYEYRLAYPNSTFLPYPSEPLPLQTLSDPLSPGSKLKFVAADGVYPNFPYHPLAPHNSIPGFDLLAKYLPKQESVVSATEPEAPQPEEDVTEVSAEAPAPAPTPSPLPVTRDEPLSPAFMILTGSLVEHGFRLPWDAATSFRRIYSSPSFRKVYEKIPVLNVFSGPKSTHDETELPVYHAYDGKEKSAGFSKSFSASDIAFVTLDTSSYASEEDGTLLGDKQVEDLKSWASAVNHTATFKFVISPVTFSCLWGKTNGTLCAYPAERQAVLNVLSSIDNVIIISGGQGEFAAIKYAENTIHEYQISPFNGMSQIPFISRLKASNSNLITKEEVVHVPNDGESAEVPEYVTLISEVEEEQLLKAVHFSVHKWGTFEVDTSNEIPTVEFTLYTNGAATWEHTIFGVPVKLRSTTYGLQALRKVKNIFNSFGFNPSKLF